MIAMFCVKDVSRLAQALLRLSRVAGLSSARNSYTCCLRPSLVRCGWSRFVSAEGYWPGTIVRGWASRRRASRRGRGRGSLSLSRRGLPGGRTTAQSTLPPLIVIAVKGQA
eukprot:2653955-Rhodomonas_salina.1